MHIAVYFPTETVRKSFGNAKTMLGRAVANHSFLLGLTEAKTDHRVTLLVPSLEDIQILNRTLLAETQANIHVTTSHRIAPYIADHPIDVLHFMDPKMAMGGRIRNLLADQDFVITGMTHSLGDQIMDCILLNDANGIEPGDCLVCTTPTAQSVIETMFAHLKEHQPDLSTPQTEVIPLGMDLSMFQEPTKLTRQELSLPEKDFVILSLARFNPLAKMDVLPALNLLSMLRQKSAGNIRLVLAGSEADGRYVQYLQDYAHKNGLAGAVQFVLSPTDEQKVALYQLADVFLSLSDNVQETFGLTVIEALASGLPAVVSDWNGYKALVEHEVTGFLIPTKMLRPDKQWDASLSLHPPLLAQLLCAQTTAVDLSAARNALLSLEADSERVNCMSRAAAASAASYDWKQIMPRYFKLWSQLCERKSAAHVSESERNRRTGGIRMHDAFSSYPSTHLSPDDCFVTSELGQLILHRKQSIQLYKETREILDPHLITEILKSGLQKISVRELLDAVRPSAPQQDDLSISQNLLWLYKYGYLEAQ